MFRKLTETLYASPQIGLGEVEEAKALGVGLIVNNRPEGESDDQVPGADIERAAKRAGVDYVAIPVTHSGFSHPQLDALNQALDRVGDAKVLAYCRSGTRSTLLWALARAKAGESPDALAAAAAQAGYDCAPVRAMMDALAAK
ncbi:MAG TPA: TIGR01244 family sulfur transferase [Novosphingobium sp.]|nr:TIGR01244 family sulfur transferase [Novosphingobium sp.]